MDWMNCCCHLYPQIRFLLKYWPANTFFSHGDVRQQSLLLCISRHAAVVFTAAAPVLVPCFYLRDVSWCYVDMPDEQQECNRQASNQGGRSLLCAFPPRIIPHNTLLISSVYEWEDFLLINFQFFRHTVASKHILFTLHTLNSSQRYVDSIISWIGISFPPRVLSR